MNKARVLFCAVLTVSQMSLLLANSVMATETTPVQPIITEVQVATDDEFVELYNPSDAPLPLTDLFLWYHGSGTAPTLTQLVNLNTITIDAHQFAVFGHAKTTGISLTAGFANQLNNTVGAVFVAKETAPGSKVPSGVVDKAAWGAAASGDGYHYYDVQTAAAPPASKSIERCFVSGTVQVASPRDTSAEFTVYDSPTPGLGTDCSVPELPVPAVNCEGIAINEIGANLDDQFIELYNTLPAAVPLAGCQLQTNRSSQSYVLSQAELAAGAYMAIHITDTPLTLTKTTTGTVYLLSSDGQVETDIRAYSNLDTGTSWSYFADGWAQTYAPTPGEANITMPYLPCETGYYRNLTTGRCNVIPADDPTAPCQPGQYRSDETGRCRNLATTADTRKPCHDDQYRSEETGRCRNIVLASSTRKPCKDNQYRSEETGRCRNLPVGTVPEAAFAVQPVKESGMAFAGWWALGGVVLLAVSYGIWEWRREFVQLWRRIRGR